FLQVGLGTEIIPLGLLNRSFEKCRIYFCDCLPFFDPRVEVNIELLDRAGHLGADLNGRYRRKIAGCRDCRDNRAALDFGGLEADLGRTLREKIAGNAGYKNDNGQDDEVFFHYSLSIMYIMAETNGRHHSR